MAEKEVEIVMIPESRLIEMLETLRKIELITSGLTTFNPTYEKINFLARQGLNIKEGNDGNQN